MEKSYTIIELPSSFKWLYDMGHFFVDPKYEREFLSAFPCLNKQ